MSVLYIIILTISLEGKLNWLFTILFIKERGSDNFAQKVTYLLT